MVLQIALINTASKLHDADDGPTDRSEDCRMNNTQRDGPADSSEDCATATYSAILRTASTTIPPDRRLALNPRCVCQIPPQIVFRFAMLLALYICRLLREQLTSSLGPPHSPQTGRPTGAYSVIEERARPVGEGYQPYRLLRLGSQSSEDIILDVLSQHLTTHYSFFLALLSFFPWSGSYRRPLPVNEAMDVNPDISEMTYRGKNLDEVLTLAEAQIISPATKKSGGARVLAQVLGFKFSYYQSADVSEHTPRNLFHTAAILIWEGFIALEDLYPHLSPKDEDMDAFREEYLSDVRISGAKSSLLAMAAPPESGPSSSHNQKVGLLTSLLAVGALKPAIAIMSKFRRLVDANPEIADLTIRILKIAISALYDSKFSKERNPSFNRPKARYGPSGLVQPNPRKPVLTLWAPVPPGTNAIDFVFFFPDWADRIPICNSLDDLKDVVEPLLRFIGVQVSRDPFFLTKFVKLGRLYLQSLLVDPITKTGKLILDNDPKHPITTFWFTALRQYLLPSLSLVRGNAVFAVEVWAIIRLYSTSHRWRLYGEWRNTYQSYPELRIRAVQAERESKGILRRLSHNAIDSLSGAVAKMSHLNPCIFFTQAVNQVMADDNLADVVIQALKNVTNMGFDILVFIAVAALANPGKERVKDDGVNTSDWLQSLASFLGMLFRRYGADLSAVLQYIVHQLSNRQTTEIVVLRELIWKMAGIEPLPTLSESQMAAMAGGPALRTEALASAVRGARLDPSDIGLKGPQRLGKNLLESSSALPLLIQVAQQRQACVYNAPNAHLKSLAGLYDATHGVLLQYLEVLTSPSVISADDYATKVLPPFPELAQVYGICPPICMQIIRPVLNASLPTSALAMQEQERIANEEAEKRLKAALTAKREPGSAASRVASPAIGNSVPSDVPDPKAVAVGEPETAMEVDSVPSAILPKEDSPWLPELAAHFDDIKAIAPGGAYEVIGPGFYLTFWQLSTYDLMPPGSKYDEEGSKLRRQEDSQYIAADRSSDRSKRLTAATHRNRRDRYNMFVNILAQEFKEQTISRAFTIKRLAKLHRLKVKKTKANFKLKFLRYLFIILLVVMLACVTGLKLHFLGDYVCHRRLFGTTDSYSMQLGELAHRLVKRFYSLTNKKEAEKQISKKTRGNQKCTPRRPSYHFRLMQFTIKHFFFCSQNAGDLAKKDRLLGRLLERNFDGENAFSNDERNTVHLVNSTIFRLRTARINYTTYDMRRAYDLDLDDALHDHDDGNEDQGFEMPQEGQHGEHLGVDLEGDSEEEDSDDDEEDEDDDGDGDDDNNENDENGDDKQEEADDENDTGYEEF
ncbi:hypothetical protein GALMADRAFT_148396 [Galerina marginata CBS 339.88]|uniref:THO complex subunit 2 n=1 Tax=Galerina marginata (strain CBS 339.88) TaxID=685588 RepID=A0A067S7D8_GALM3|nr:hypothetical protein GALMADRAFT_148396 [Galerina marginata CBS 339.88]